MGFKTDGLCPNDNDRGENYVYFFLNRLKFQSISQTYNINKCFSLYLSTISSSLSSAKQKNIES